MREAIGGTWIFQIVIVFILLFTGFMCLSINRSKAFNVKDQILQTIQSYNGIDLTEYNGEEDTPMADIISYLKENSYRTTGNVPTALRIGDEDQDYTCFNREGKYENDNPVFCIAKISTDQEGCAPGSECFHELPKMNYYRVVVFYQLDLPIFHELFNFKIMGDTKIMVQGGNL